MKNDSFIRMLLIVTVSLLVFNVFMLSIYHAPASYAAKNVEYKLIDTMNMVRDIPQMEMFFNELGKEGWELVQVLAGLNTQCIIFKK